ncbi:hypothetical protein ACO0LM_11825 [Undibacterium sp. Di26W]|uniref:hypothetical protein n=1 Tax=Undibacterium sp. Di26W TaxID=3413035 RepID=UPI003BF17DB6
MTISAGDVKLVKSKVMDDVPEGGGPPTSVAIIDATSNAIFEDISETARAGGQVNLRKLFTAINTNDVDKYFGANVIVAAPPSDEKVSITLFSTGQVFDVRASAKGRIESYLSIGSRYPGYLFGDHIAGQRIVTLLQRENIAVPAVGDTLVLRKNQDLPTMFEQYVKVIDVSSRVRNFTDSSGDFTRLEVSLELSDALTQDFNGLDATKIEPTEAMYANKTRLFSTIVADAARYYGVVKSVESAAIGDLVIKGSGIFTQLVPSTRIEVPIADARMSQRQSAAMKAGEVSSNNVAAVFNTSQAFFVGGRVLPGSFSIRTGGVTLKDKGGVLMNDSIAVGAFDYDNGVATLATNVFGTGTNTFTFEYIPAGTPVSITNSVGVPVTAQGQRSNWVFTVDSIPARGTTLVSFRALQKWYVLSDDGSGALRGADSAVGAGTINFPTGTISATLGTLPDVGSQIIIQWVDSTGARPLNAIPLQAGSLGKAFGKVALINDAIKPGALTLTWNDGTLRTATDSNGTLVGDASGTVNYTSGKIVFRPNTLPAINTEVTVSSTNATANTGGVNLFTDGGANWTLTVTAPIRPKTFEMSVYTKALGVNWLNEPVLQRKLMRVYDNGAGNLQVTSGTTNLNVGTINYTTGACVLFKTTTGYNKEDAEYLKNDLLADGTIVFGRFTGRKMYFRDLTILNGPEI